MRTIKNVIGANRGKRACSPTRPLKVSDLGVKLLAQSRAFMREEISEDEYSRLISYQGLIHKGLMDLAELPKNLSVSVVRNTTVGKEHHVLYNASLTLYYGKTINSASKAILPPVNYEEGFWHPEWKVHAECADSLYNTVTSMLHKCNSLETSKFKALEGYCNSDITYFDRFGKEFIFSPKSISSCLPRINSTTALERIGYDAIFKHLCEPINDLFRQSIENQIQVVGNYCKEHDEIYQEHFVMKGEVAYNQFADDLAKCLEVVSARCEKLLVPCKVIDQFVSRNRKELATLYNAISALNQKGFYVYHLRREACYALNDLMYDHYKREGEMSEIPALDLAWLSASAKLVSQRFSLKMEAEVLQKFIQKLVNSKEYQGRLEFVI